MSWPRVAAFGLACLTGIATVSGVSFVAASGDRLDQAYLGVAVALAAASTALGVLVTWRRPANPVGALLCWIGLLPAAMALGDLGPARPGVEAALSAGAWVWLYVPVALLMLLFPDGKLPGRRWRWVAAALPLTAIGFQAVAALGPDPGSYGVLPEPAAIGLTLVLLPGLLGLLIAAAVSLRVRYRRADEVVRRQLKWLALAGFALPATLLLCWASYLLLNGPDLVLIGLALLYVGVPLATAIAILRHDLYDVDRAISAAVTYGAVTAALLAVFTVASFASGVVLGRGSAAAAAGATALTAVALAPLRSRLQRAVDRRLYPARRAALAAIAELRQRANLGDARPEQLEEVLRTALRDPGLRVGFVLPGAAGFVDAAGQPVDVGPDSTPVVLGEQQIGAIAASGVSSRQLLRDVAAAAALLVELVRLRVELSEALWEVRSSRTRLLRVGYQERRRLERDLHDGAQQRLVSLGMALRLAQRHLRDGTVDMDALLDQSVAELGTAVAELRQLAHGLRPSCLDDGLHPALSVLAESAPLPVDLDIAVDGGVPDDIATTAYYVVNEAVANAVKHAGAARIRLRITQPDGRLRVRVEDDGCGGANPRPGSGLAGLADRVAAAGGSLRVLSPVGEGTTVEAMLPCGS